MKYLISILLFTLFVGTSFSKEPKEKEPKTVGALAKYLVADAKSDSAKVEKIHTWITNNIAYNYKQTESDKCYKYESAETVLKERKALCTGYVRLMQAMLAEVGIESQLVPGYTYAFKQFYKPNVLLDNHAWITININGEWFMADPTWDAGYIGSLAAEKFLKKLEKKNEKIALKNDKLLSKGKDTVSVLNIDSLLTAKNPTGKMGFISEPNDEWFLTDGSKFLMRHLPANPMWQLRKDTISLSHFLLPDSVLKSKLKEVDPSNNGFDYLAEVQQFGQLNVLDQALYMGADAYSYNPKNHRVKAYYYYYYLSILNDKEIQKQIKNLDLSKSFRLRTAMLQIMDSTVYYAKLGETLEKERYKDLTSYYKSINKSSQTNNKLFVKAAEKGLKWNDKAISTIEKRQLKIDKEYSKLEPVAIANSLPKENVIEWNGKEKLTDETRKYVHTIKQSVREWITVTDEYKALVENSSLERAYELMAFNNYLLQRRSAFLAHKSLNFNDYIDTIDAVVTANLDSLENIYTSQLEIEAFNDKAYKIINNLSAYIISQSEQMTLWVEQGIVSDVQEFDAYAQANLVRMMMLQYNMSKTAYEHNIWMLEGLVTIVDEWSEFENLALSQEKLTLDKNEYLLEQAEHDHKREEDLCETIQEKVEEWEKIATGK